MTATTVHTEITGPGVYDIPADAYHADPVPGGSLSSTGARRLLPPSCPAKFRYWLDHPPAPTDAMQLGTAAHRAVLGVGAELVEVRADTWRTKAAQQQRIEAAEAGAVALLTEQFEQAQAMATALRADKRAAALFDPGHGIPEQALIWRDPESGIWRRALLDFLRHRETTGRLVVVDYKTAAKADEESVRQAILRFGYHQQGAWYADGVRALGLADDVPVVLVVQETDPPYLVNAVQLDQPAMRIGGWLNRQAIDLYAECTRTGHWPGYGDDIRFSGLPYWAESRAIEEMNGR